MRKLFKELIKNISKEKIEEIYITQNLSQKQCADLLEISVGLFNSLLKHYNIHKDKKLCTKIIKQVKLERYGDENYNNRDKSKETCLNKYGYENPFQDLDKVKTGYIKSFGNDHPMHNEQIKQKVHDKRDYIKSSKKGFETYKQKTGYDNPSKNPEVIKKNLQTRIANGVFDSNHISNLEKRLNKILIRKYTEVNSHYRDKRYARNSGYMFECDFYIPKLDLFIELNAHPSHYKYPYEYKKDDKILANKFQKSDKAWEKAIYKTWRIYDYEKIKIAKENKLNYIVLYPETSIQENQAFNNKKYSELIKYLLIKLLKK